MDEKILKSMREKYIGRRVQLWPGDTADKIAVIKSVDALGWTFEITDMNTKYVASAYKIGDVVFVPHSNSRLIFKIL